MESHHHNSTSQQQRRQLLLVTGSSAGVRVHVYDDDNDKDGLFSTLEPDRGDHTTTTPVCHPRFRQTLDTSSTAVSTLHLVPQSLYQQQQQQQQTTKKNTADSSCHQEQDNALLLLVGTAAPRHNKISVYQWSNHPITNSTSTSTTTHDQTSSADSRSEVVVVAVVLFLWQGALMGHEDWITCLDWWCRCRWCCRPTTPMSESETATTIASCLLASGSQDCRIRLWKFTTTRVATNVVTAPNRTTTNRTTDRNQSPQQTEPEHAMEPKERIIIIDSDDEQDNDTEHTDEGESRLEIRHTDHSNQTYVTNVTLEALLLGHEASVTSVCWHPHPQRLYNNHHQNDQNQNNNLLLISSSMDRSILLWSPSPDDGIWTPVTRVGSAGGILGGPVGASLLGYCQALIEPKQGRTLVGHAYGGALHVWQAESEQASSSNSNSSSTTMGVVKWKATPGLTGHFAGVTDLCWEASRGDYLLTVSQDQTCRLWAPVGGDHPTKDTDPYETTDDSVWVELARPQVHGYDISAVTSLSSPHRPHLLVTGADEKELRLFDAPLSTLRLLQVACGGTATAMEEPPNGSSNYVAVDRVERAYLPALGLSNKASAEGAADQEQNEGEDDDDAVENDALLANGQRPTAGRENIRLPMERDLGAISIWPETLKLFGHTSELYCLASAPVQASGKTGLVASSTKARTVEDASIRLWNVDNGSCVQVLSGHKSTVATLSFSSDGHYLASSGKDRRLCIWKANYDSDGRKENHPHYSLGWAKDSAHKRIVWSVHFCPFQPQTLASGSRDGCIKIWNIASTAQNATSDESGLQVSLVFSFAPQHCTLDGKPDAVTALSFCPRSLNGDSRLAVLAVGLESGRIELWKIPVTVTGSENAARPELLLSLNASSECHAATVTRLAWRPHPSPTNSRKYEFLASGSLDHGVRVFRVVI